MSTLQPNELRIGNLFQTIGGKERTVDLKELTRIQRIPNLYKGIPLTEEWLLKLGYVKNERVKYIYDFRPLQLMFTPNGFEYFHSQPYGGNFLIIKYVHQLQNLYYSLTNKELTIKQ